MPNVAMQQEITLTLEEVKLNQLREDCFRVKFITSRGTDQAILHHRDGNTAGTVLLSGAGGGLDGPASIYQDMGPDLLRHNISSLRMDFRRRNHLEECVLDALMGIGFLQDQEIARIGTVGWSFGGAIAIDAGVLSDAVKAVATVASQTYGTDMVDELSPKALLLIHGTGDRTLTPACSEDIFRRAKDPKELVLYQGANHGVDQARDEMLQKIEEFLITHLQQT